MISIVTEPIDIQEIFRSVESKEAGAVDIFIGTTRNNSSGKKVLFLEYEAFAEMALKEMEAIGDELRIRWNICAASIVHRIGRVDIGEASVIIAVSSAHRKEAFESCRFAIDTLKKTVPIWKKEYFEDGAAWVDGGAAIGNVQLLMEK
jgi:molybdopterin synthase catalytic subunit